MGWNWTLVLRCFKNSTIAEFGKKVDVTENDNCVTILITVLCNRKDSSSFKTRKDTTMKIVVTGRHYDVSDEVREMIESKIEKALKVFPRIVRHVRVIIEQGSLEYLLEANVELTAKKKILVAKEKDKDIRSGIDALNANVNKQIRRLKERIEDKHKSAKKAMLSGNAEEEQDDEA